MELDALLDKTGLAHYGIKGMHWGVRRDPGPTGRVSKDVALNQKKHPDFMDAGTKGLSAAYNRKTGDLHALDKHGNPTDKVLLKNDSVPGHPSDTHAQTPHQTSADHERAAKALAKAAEKGTHALSNEELKAISNRIEAEKKFHQLTTEQRSQLQKAVDQMKLEREYRQLKAERAAATQSTGRKIVKSLIGAFGQAATKQASDYGKSVVDEMLGLNQPKLSDVLKGKNDLMRAQKEHHDLLKELQARGINTQGTVTRSAGGPFKVNPSKVKIGPTQTSVPKRQP